MLKTKPFKYHNKDKVRGALYDDDPSKPIAVCDTIDEAKALASLCNHDLRQLNNKAA